MVRAELDLVAFFRQTFRAPHDASIVDQDVETVVVGGEGLGSGFDALERGEIAFEELDSGLCGVRKRCVDFLDCSLGFALIASGEVYGLSIAILGKLV